MTITVSWVRKNKDTTELLVASDSILRSYGAIDQAQKIFRLERGDCCLGFCGDAQIAYPVFVQVGSALNNYIRTRTRAADITELADVIKNILNNLISSWDLPKQDRAQELANTKILLAGWSSRHSRFEIGHFIHNGQVFVFHHRFFRMPHAWKEHSKSLVFIGDYEAEYRSALNKVLEDRHGIQPRGHRKAINFDYEPIEALARLLDAEKKQRRLTSIGGAPQLLKVYSYGADMPIVIRTGKNDHFLLGRKLFEWEKTTYPILDLTSTVPRFCYPLVSIPLPCDVAASREITNNGHSPVMNEIMDGSDG